MADVKWIKITTDIFDDEKIMLIESLPGAYEIITVWFKLLCLAGKQNNSGVFLMGKVAYTDRMLATIFRMKEASVSMALQTFEAFGMVEIIDGVITIPNWDKHQSLDKYETAREQTRIRVAKYREKQKMLAENSQNDGGVTCNVTSNATVTQCNADRIDIDKDIDIDYIQRESDIKGGVGENEPGDARNETASGEAVSTPAPKPKKAQRHKYGEYQNVLLTDEELEKLDLEYPDCMERIERLSAYIASTGKTYKSHYATIRNWARKDKEQRNVQTAGRSGGNAYQGGSNPFLDLAREQDGKNY